MTCFHPIRNAYGIAGQEANYSQRLNCALNESHSRQVPQVDEDSTNQLGRQGSRNQVSQSPAEFHPMLYSVRKESKEEFKSNPVASQILQTR
jgi:hypothetical protein